MAYRAVRARLAAALAVAIAFSFAPVQSTHAAAFTVDSSADAVDAAPGDGVCATLALPDEGVRCTLRAAVMEANALGGAPTITVPSGTFRLTNGPIEVAQDLQIFGNGAARTIID